MFKNSFDKIRRYLQNECMHISTPQAISKQSPGKKILNLKKKCYPILKINFDFEYSSVL